MYCPGNTRNIIALQKYTNANNSFSVFLWNTLILQKFHQSHNIRFYEKVDKIGFEASFVGTVV